MYKLSICIPTYNRAPFLRELLNSILSQADPSIIEIVISDNASSDNTSEVVKEYKSRYKNIRYFCWPRNVGADRNYLMSVNVSRGDFCWLMGSDDKLANGAVSTVLKALNENPADVFLFNRYNCDFQMNHLLLSSWVGDFEYEHVLDSTQDFASYISKCKTLGGVFSYLSTIVVRRDKWDASEINLIYMETLYSHVAVIFAMIKNGGRFTYKSEVIVCSRGGNDSFMKNWAQRALVDINGYIAICEIFNDKRISNEIKNLLRREHNFKYLSRLLAKMLFDLANINITLKYLIALREKTNYPLIPIVVGILISPILAGGYFIKLALRYVR